MFKLKHQIAEIIYYSMKDLIDRERWLAPEVSNLGIKHHGLDDISLDAILPLVALYANGSLDVSEILRATEIDLSSFNNYIDAVSEYNLLAECPNSGKYKLTDEGTSACKDIFQNVAIRKRFELKRELDQLETILSKLSEL